MFDRRERNALVLTRCGTGYIVRYAEDVDWHNFLLGVLGFQTHA